MAQFYQPQERWIKHYSSSHKILLVGEGDFSFSACLANAFQSATNIVATSLDSYEDLTKKYKFAAQNIWLLKRYGATVLHGVDATRMKYFPDLQGRKFHRIVYNFPHAGFHQKEDNHVLITMHRSLVRGFLSNASCMLYPAGEIHVSHKTTSPFNKWNIEDLARTCSLVLVASDKFKIQDYPGYQNKRGDGMRCDHPFPLGECTTFKFQIAFHRPTINVQQRPNVPVPRQPLPPSSIYNDVILPVRLSSHLNMSSECHRLFGGYLKYVEETFGRSDSCDDVCHSVREALRHGFRAYMGSSPVQNASGYIRILEELHHLTAMRSQQLREILAQFNAYR